MKPSFAFAAAAAAGLLLAAAPGCSSNTIVNSGSSGSAAPCDSSQCLAGNKCLPYLAETKCRKVCTSNTDPAGSCPYGYTCLKADPNFEAFCVKDNVEIRKAAGQWGTRCNPAGGLEGNPDCDGQQGFYCYALSPTDGDAYCTRYGCESDRDCGATFYCGDANVGPNATTAKRTIRETQKVCLRRDYCTPCVGDLDCPATISGRPAHCATDDDGKGFCTPECTNDKNCGNDAQCVDAGIGATICYPRAKRCVGDGSICSPCLADTDCGEDGVCVKGQYTTERSCAKPSKITCKAGGSKQGTDFDCPAATPPQAPQKAIIRCLGDSFEQVPRNFCHGLYPFGESADVGCWSPER